MKTNPFTSPRYIILSLIDTILIVLAVIGYLKLDVLEVLGAGFEQFVFENWLALGIAGVIIMMLNTFVSVKEHLAGSRVKQDDLKTDHT